MSSMLSRLDESEVSEVSNTNGQTKKQKQIVKDKSMTSTKRATKQVSYKEKIKDIALDDEDWNEEYAAAADFINEELDHICDDEMRKSEKIRLSAQMTRKRRKMYIEKLEKKVRVISEELEQAKARIMSFESEQKSAPSKPPSSSSSAAAANAGIMSQLHTERQKLFDKLEEKIKEKDEVEIEYIMDSMRLRLGLAGKTRTQALNSFFDDIVKLIMPFHMKYLIWIATENLDIFDIDRRNNDNDSQESGWFKHANLSDETIHDVKIQITNSKSLYDDLLHSMDAVKTKIAQLNEFSQTFIDDLRNYFPPSNIAKFLIELDKKRDLYERNNLYPGSLWQELCNQQKQSQRTSSQQSQIQQQQQPMQVLQQQTQQNQQLSQSGELQLSQHSQQHHNHQTTTRSSRQNSSNSSNNNLIQQQQQQLNGYTSIHSNNYALQHQQHQNSFMDTSCLNQPPEIPAYSSSQLPVVAAAHTPQSNRIYTHDNLPPQMNFFQLQDLLDGEPAILYDESDRGYVIGGGGVGMNNQNSSYDGTNNISRGSLHNQSHTHSMNMMDPFMRQNKIPLDDQAVGGQQEMYNNYIPIHEQNQRNISYNQ